MKKFLLFASAALLIAGCSKNPTPPAGPDPVDPVLVVDETPIPVDAEGVADRAIAVESNGEWTAAIENATEKTWITLDGATGTGNGSFTFSVVKNGVTTSRNATIHVTMGSSDAALERSIVVTQAAADGAVTIDKDVITADAGGKTDKIAVTSNGLAWSATVENAAQNDWITLTDASGTSSGEITVTIDPKTTVGSRNAKIFVTPQGETPYEVAVTQTGVNPDLSITPAQTTIELDKAGETYTVTVTSNVPWDINAVDAPAGVSVTGKTGNTTGNGSFNIVATANDTFNPRSGSITIVPESGSGAENIVLNLSQAAGRTAQISATLKGGGAINTTNVVLNAVRNRLEIAVTSNVNWTLNVENAGPEVVLYDPSQVGNAGSNVDRTITIGQNTGAEREITISIAPTQPIPGFSPVTYTVKQAAATAPRGWFETSSGGTPAAEFEIINDAGRTITPADADGLKVVSANTTWSITLSGDGADWVTVAPNMANGDAPLVITVAKNETTEPRETTMTLTGTGVSAGQSIVIKQMKGTGPIVGQPDKADGALVAGIRWAHYYVDVDGNFEKSGDMSKVAIFQFNSKLAFAHSSSQWSPGNPSGWRGGAPSSGTTYGGDTNWDETLNGPCPNGWRLPTKAEAEALLALRAQSKARYIDGTAFVFGDNAATTASVADAITNGDLYMPVTHIQRRGLNDSAASRVSGTPSLNFWTSEQDTNTRYAWGVQHADTAGTMVAVDIDTPRVLGYNSGNQNGGPDFYRGKNHGMAVRCVWAGVE